MKISKYTTEIKINDDLMMLYNTFTREYFTYTFREKSGIDNLLSNLTKTEFSISEITAITNLYRKGIIIKNDLDEIEALKYMENGARYQQKVFYLTIYATNACNFRCTYCSQDHNEQNLQPETAEAIVNFVKQISREVKILHIRWFGGEPILQFQVMDYIMEKSNLICKKNHCKLEMSVTTNGYLLNKEMLLKMKRYNLQALQITIDGNKKDHDKKRILKNGQGTYDRIRDNMIEALIHGIQLVLRINFSDKQELYDVGIMYEIPTEYRALVTVNFCNVFQNEKKISMYELYKRAIDMGYRLNQRKNRYVSCDAARKNSLYIDANGKILICSNTCNNEPPIGVIEASGKIKCIHKEKMYKMKTITAIDNKRCRGCIKLPFCVGSCTYWRMNNDNQCIDVANDGMSLEERALLDYYYDCSIKNKF